MMVSAEICLKFLIMRQNLGGLDKVVRFVIAVVIGVLYFTNMISGTVALVALVFAVVLIGTALIGTCPIYLALGLSSKAKEKI